MTTAQTQRPNAMQWIVRTLGPGLLFAGAAIGVSHLVQSTRAGAEAGLALIPIILLANITKYPGLSFGPRYTNATGFTLLESYRRQGMLTLSIFALLTIGTMFVIEAAVTLVTASIVKATIIDPMFGEGSSLITSAIVVVVLVTIVLASGGFKWLDWLMKILLTMMAVLLLIATVLVLPKLEMNSVRLWPEASIFSDVALLTFVVALAGWMPAPMDIAAWNSLWCLAHEDETTHKPTRREAAFDFNIGFGLCIFTSLCFCILGAVLMYQPQAEFSPSAAVFANQVINLFTESIGDWSRPLIAAAALGVMFSTTITVLDAIPRVLVVLFDRFRTPETHDDARRDLARTRGYWLFFAILAAGSLGIQQFALGQFKTLIDIATILAFVTTPILAWFNHRAMFSADVPPDQRPGHIMKTGSLLCIIVLGGFTAFFLWVRFVA